MRSPLHDQQKAEAWLGATHRQALNEVRDELETALRENPDPDSLIDIIASFVASGYFRLRVRTLPQQRYMQKTRILRKSQQKPTS